MNIVQYWNSTVIPHEIQELISSWSNLNPRDNHRVFDSTAAVEFVAENYDAEITAAFQDITIPAMSCDVFRVAYLLKEGGVYVDCGSRCLQPISAWGISSTNLTLLRKWHGAVWNGLICAPAGHPWLSELWDRISSVLRDRQEGNIWALTGPLLFTEIAEKEALMNANDRTYSIAGSDHNERSMSVIEQNNFASRFTLVNDLKHKSRAHWSKLQNVIPLFEAKVTEKYDNKAALPVAAKKLVIQLAVTSPVSMDTNGQKVSTFEETDVKAPSCENEVITKYIGRNNHFTSNCTPYADQTAFINAARVSNAETYVITVDLTQFTMGACYDKPGMTGTLVELSFLASQFETCEIVYFVFDQVGVVSDSLLLQSDDSGVRRQTDIDALLKNPALDFNLFDEALRFFFKGSKLTPLYSSERQNKKGHSAQSGDALTAEEADRVRACFLESNRNYVQKYPQMHSLLDQCSEIAVGQQ